MSYYANAARATGRSMEINNHGPPPRNSACSWPSYKEADNAVRDDEPEPEGADQHTVHRDLKGYHVFFITMGGIMGIGLYVRSSDMLRIGGPAAVVIPFIFFTILAWMVMQCISEMLLIWPVSGALRLFVQKFVDKELGIVVAVAYWFTWALAFAALIAATAEEARVWPSVSSNKAQQGCVFLALGSILILGINLLPVRFYGISEVILGTIKIFFFVLLVGAMMGINLFGAGQCEVLGLSQWSPNFTKIDLEVAKNWAGSFFLALQVAAFAFTGIEIPAALAVEADIMHNGNQVSTPKKTWLSPILAQLRRLIPYRKDEGTANRGPANRTLKFSSVYLPLLIGGAYYSPED